MQITGPARRILIIALLQCLFFQPFTHAAVSSFSDDFTLPNGSPPSSNWTVALGTWTIGTNRIYHVSSTMANPAILVLNVPLAGDDYDVNVHASLLSIWNDQRGILARYQNNQNYYYGRYFHSEGAVQIVKVQNGVSTPLATTYVTRLPYDTEFTMRMVAEGSLLKFYLNGTLKVQISDATFSTGKVGIYSYDASHYFDDFSVSAYNVSQPPNPPTVDELPEFIMENHYVLSGTKPADTSVWIDGDERVPINSSTAWSHNQGFWSDGQEIFSIVTKNQWGVSSTIVSVPLTIDLNPPVIQVIRPLDQATVSHEGFRFEGTASDTGSGIQEIKVSVKDFGRKKCGIVSGETTVSEAPVSYDEAQGTWYFDVLPEHVSPGFNAELTVKALDYAGRLSTQMITVHVDLPEPLIGTISIAGGAEQVNVREVMLDLTASGNVTLTSFSNDGVEFTEPEAFASQKSWTLSEGNGPKTVSVKFSNDNGDESEVFSDTIDLHISVETERIFIYAGDKRIAMEENGEKSFILQDHLGSTNVMVNEAAQEVSYTEYKSFGSIKTETAVKSFNKKFTGKELDDSTGLYDYDARQYDAEIGRFISADPIEPQLEDPQTLNRYSYTLNNPLKYIDPSGNSAVISDALRTLIPGFGAVAPFIGVPGFGELVLGGAAIITAAAIISNPEFRGTTFPALGPIGASMYLAGKSGIGKSRGEADIYNKTFSRFMSKKEAKVMEKTGLLRGGREGDAHFTTNKFRTKESAIEKLSLNPKNKYDVRSDFKITNKPNITGPGTVKGRYGQPGGAKEYTTSGQVKVKTVRVVPLTNRK